MASLRLLVDPVELRALPRDNIAFVEPESNLLLGVLNRVGAMADIPADIDSEIPTDSARCRSKRVCGTEEGCGTAGLEH